MLSPFRTPRQVIPALPCVLRAVGFVIVAWTASSAFAQGGNLGGFGTLGGVEPTGQYPPQQYYAALEIYRDGDLVEAADGFEAALRSGRRDVRGRWIDSIPALTMLAECNWQLGNLPAAREHLDHVFQIAVTYEGWLSRVEWESIVQGGVQRATPQWLWPEAAAIPRVPVSDRVKFVAGQPLTEAVLRQGGEIQELNIRTMDVVEIMRTLALASYRRRILLGPLTYQDPLAERLQDATKYPAGLPVSLAKTLIGSLRTAGQFTVYDDQRTVEEAAKYAMFSGSAHPVSALAMLSQLSAMAGAQEVDAVPSMAIRMVHVAAVLEQPEFMGEAMQLAAGCSNAAQANVVKTAADGFAKAMFRKSRMASLHCMVAGADAAITAGDLDSAAALLAQAQSLSGRRDVLLPRINAYGAYVAARLAAARGSSIGVSQTTDLDQAINQMASFALNHRIRSQVLISMPRIYQLGLVSQAIGTIGGNTADQLLKAYGDDPPMDVWRRDAVDALASVMVDRTFVHLARVNLAVSNRYSEPLLLASDAMFAGRFLQRLPLGGRVAQIRALAGFDDSVLDKDIVDFRNKLGREMADLRAASLAAGAGDPARADAIEAKACALALSRIPLPQVVPARLDEKSPVAKLPPRTGLLTFTAAGNNLYGTLAADGKVTMWAIPSSRLSTEIGRLLREIGVGKPRGNRIPEDDSWREAAVNLRSRLLPDESAFAPDLFDELIVVPDGPLWYLPMELLPIGEKDSELLGDKLAIRYAPTPGMALNPAAPPPVGRAIGLCADLFFAPRDAEQNDAIIQSIIDVVDDPVRLPESPEIPTGLLGDKVGHLVVAAPRTANPKNPLLFGIARYDESSPWGTLAGWMRFPVQGPRTVVLFGMRTPVDIGQIGSGEEIFATLCALHASGVRSVLISRWAVGGESSAIALRELVQELPFEGLNESWRRARGVLRRSELNPAAEPLLTKAEHDLESLTGDQPLFWSGYLVSSPNQPTAE